MVDQPMVVVRGEAFREVPPELAVFSVTVTATDRDRHATLTRLSERAAEMRSALDDYPDAIERQETGGVLIHPDLKRGQPVSYSGSVSTTVAVTDFAVLSDLLLRLASQEQTSVAGPWWQLRPGSAAGAEVRRAAIADALARAKDYADAVGARVDRLVEISDEAAGGHPVMLRAAAFDTSATNSELQIEPQLQTVQATIVVRVAITEPESL